MQVAIFVVLVLILVVMAPWVLALAAAAVVAYGIWVVVTGLVFFLLSLGLAAYYGYKSRRPTISSELEATIKRVNDEYRRKQAEAGESTRAVVVDPVKQKPKKLISCRVCSAEIEKFSLFCPVCGKNPI